jgi:hypothetical protein
MSNAAKESAPLALAVLYHFSQAYSKYDIPIDLAIGIPLIVFAAIWIWLLRK